MRQPLKPFSVETRQNGRRKPRPSANTPRDIFVGMDPDGSRTQSYDAALRAADILFGNTATPQPADSPEPPTVDSPMADDPFAAAAPRPQGRILQAIEEPVVEWATPIAQPAARRGRPPGSKNKVTRVPTAARIRKKDETASRIDMTADELVASLFGTAELVEPVVVKRSTPVAIPSSDARLRFSWISKTLEPGERWKRRLPRVCW